MTQQGVLQAPGAAAGAAAQKDSWRTLPVEKRLQHALVKGIDEFAVSYVLCGLQ